MSTPSTSRRGRVAGKPPIANNPDAALFALCAEHVAKMKAYQELPPHLEVVDRDPVEFDAYLAARDAVMKTKPQTMVGLLAKARAAMADLAFYAWDGDEENQVREAECLVWSVFFDFLRLQGACHDQR